MRDLVIVGIVVGALPFAVLHTWIGVLLWNWISLMNPHKLGYGFALSAPLAAAAGGATLLSLVMGREKLRMPTDGVVIVLFLFVLWMCFTTAFALDPAGSLEQLVRVLKIQLIMAVAFAAIQSRKQIELFIWVIVISIGFYGIKGGIFTLLTGGALRVYGPSGSFIEDNNSLAVAVIMTIPLMNYLRLVSARALVRHALLGMMVLSAIGALGSQSRGALLAISSMTIVLWLRSSKKVLVGVVLAGLAAGLVAFMPASWEQRMSTIETYQEDGSAMSRIDAWKMCFNLANDRPIGGGFDIYNWDTYGKYNPYAEKPQVAHSIYFSVLGEQGWVGLFLFVLLGILTYRLATRIRRDTKKLPEAAWAHHLAGMCQVSFVGFAVGAAFLSLAYFDLPYNIIVVLVAVRRWLSDKAWQQEPKGAFDSGDPLDAKAYAKTLAGKATP